MVTAASGTDNNDDNTVSENKSACGVLADSVSFMGNLCRLPHVYDIFTQQINKNLHRYKTVQVFVIIYSVAYHNLYIYFILCYDS